MGHVRGERVSRALTQNPRDRELRGSGRKKLHMLKILLEAGKVFFKISAIEQYIEKLSRNGAAFELILELF